MLKIKSDFAKSISVLMLMAVIPIIGFQLNKAPRSLPEDAPLEEFSADRAMKHMHHIASKPHSIGTKEHSMVFDYIVEELRKMGIEPIIQTAEVFYPASFLAATVRNVIARLPGTNSGKSVLMVGHYDSVRYSYGASDDGSAIVTMLETIRVLLLGQPFKNDIVFVFTDGEEVGLLGAKAFIDNHPLAKNIGLVLNFESSGTKGPSLMFETSNDNNWIISEFAKVVPLPLANSLSYEIYRHMPNDTDFTPFKKSGFKGFNFAYLENRFDYHTGGDNILNTSVESIQHNGSYAIPLIQHFANIDLNNSEKGNAVYFNAIGKAFVHYPYHWIVPFLILTFLLLVGTLFLGFRKKIIRPLRLLYGFFAFMIHLVIAPSVVTLIYFILTKYYPGNDFRLLFYHQGILLGGFVALAIAFSFTFYLLALRGVKIWHLGPFIAALMLLLIWSNYISLITVLVTLGISTLIYLLYRKPTNVWELTFGSFLGWTVLMVVASLKMPGVSYLFTWPLMFSIIPVLIFFLGKDQNKHSFFQIILFLLFALPAILWLSYLSSQFQISLGLKLSGGAVLLIVLCLSLLIIHMDIITRMKPWVVPIISFTAALLLLWYGSVNLEYGERHKKENSLILVTDGNTNNTFFTSLNVGTDEWLSDYLSPKPDTFRLDYFYPYRSKEFLAKRVDGENLPMPNLSITKDSLDGSLRLLKFHINSGREADNLTLQIKSDSDSIFARINNSTMKVLKRLDGSEWFIIRYYAFPEEGIDLELRVLDNQNVEMRLTDFIYGLPVLREGKINPRPDYMMSSGDMTVATKTFVF